MLEQKYYEVTDEEEQKTIKKEKWETFTTPKDQSK